MPNFDILIGFFVATCIFAYIPGPAMLYATAQTLARGKRAGWFAAIGIHMGGYIHVLAAAMGLALLFKAIPTIYIALKFAGAAYLIWLGFKLFLNNEKLTTAGLKISKKSASRAFWESVTVEALNPKTAIFFLAFLPQFTDPHASFPIWLQMLILGTIVNLMFSSADIVCVLLADKMSEFLRNSQKAGKYAQKFGGGILVALGMNIAFNRQ